MKKSINLFLILVLLLSCESEETINSQEFNQKQIDNVLKLDGQSQKNAYLLLEPSLKYKIWVDKLSEDKKYVNHKQSYVIDKLIKIIDPNFFDTNRLSNTEYTNSLEVWTAEANSVFERKEFIQIFVSLQYLTTTLNPATDGDDRGSCSCNTFHDFCFFDDCTASASCSTSFKGCGLLWDYSCNGKC